MDLGHALGDMSVLRQFVAKRGPYIRLPATASILLHLLSPRRLINERLAQPGKQTHDPVDEAIFGEANSQFRAAEACNLSDALLSQIEISSSYDLNFDAPIANATS